MPDNLSLPLPQLPVTNSATGAAAASTTATLPAVANQTLYITGFQVTTLLATGAVGGLVTVTGVKSGTLSYQYQQVTAAGNGLAITFPMPLAASGTNQAIAVNIAAMVNGGATAVVVVGFYI